MSVGISSTAPGMHRKGGLHYSLRQQRAPGNRASAELPIVTNVAASGAAKAARLGHAAMKESSDTMGTMCRWQTAAM